MRKLLLLINGILLAFVITSCSPKAKQIPSNGSEINGGEDNPRAIIHTSPEQAKIDSIKAVKMKERNGK